MALTLAELTDAVAGDTAGVRTRVHLEPLGGSDDKVFPPTYGVPDNAATRYAIEQRVVRGADGTEHSEESVVLDSVSSQANRFELTLLDAIRDGAIEMPVTSVDFRTIDDLESFDRISDYEAPHRIFDALLRDSLDGDLLFRSGEIGTAITEATPRNATGLLVHSPHTLLFGGWDSTGPRGGRGAKYERALTSEVVALGIERGVKTTSRLDPTGIEKAAATLYKTHDGTWTLFEEEAEKDKGKPVLYGKGSELGRPSQANLGNVTPSIDRQAGGVTARTIVGTTVLSLIQLRRLRFATLPDGAAIPDSKRKDAETAARALLAALGFAASTLAFEGGFDLRSRCVLVSKQPPSFEFIGRTGDVHVETVTGDEALDLVRSAAAAVASTGLPLRTRELLLRPTDRLAELIRRSHPQDIATSGGDESGAE